MLRTAQSKDSKIPSWIFFDWARAQFLCPKITSVANGGA